MQWLVMLRAPETDTFEGVLPPAARIAQLLPPRMAIVEGEPAVAETLRGDDRLTLPDDGPVDSAHTLTESEEMFIGAWLARKDENARKGEGLAWDAPGYSPP